MIEFISYTPLYGLFILLPLLYFFSNSLVERSKLKKVLSFVLRVLAIIFLLLALCRPFYLSSRSDQHFVFLIDVSESIDLGSVKEAVLMVRQKVKSLKPEDSWSLYAFGSYLKRYESLDQLDDVIEQWQKHISDDQFRKESFVSSALLSSRMAFPSNKVKHLILLSDGKATGHGLERAIRVLNQEGIKIHFYALDSLLKPEASVIEVSLITPKAFFGERSRLKVKLSSNKAMKGKLKLISRDIVEVEKDIQLEVGNDNEFAIDITLDNTGLSEYRVELDPEEDYFLVNNKASCLIEVVGRAKVLAIHEKPSKLNSLSRALKKQGIELEIRGKRGVPESLEGLLNFEAVILANISAADMTQRQMLQIKNYVTNFGGGLLMMGSENSFGIGGYYKTPVEEVLPIVSRYEKEKEKPSLAMVIVIDKSGSMNGIKMQMAQQASKAAVELLGARDQVSIIAFDGSAYTVSEMMSASNLGVIHDAIDGVAAGGGTNMYPAMEMGRDKLLNVPAKIKHMIVLGDGQSQGGPFENLAMEMAAERMTVSTVALGQGADQALMKTIAEVGRGRFYATLDPESVPKIFTKETMEASKSAIKEEPFLPVRLGNIDFLDGVQIEESPFLLGYVMTKPKATSKVHLLTEMGDPLLATGQFGLGFGAAFSSDATEKWAGEWQDWKGFGKFWAQILRKILRKSDSSGISVNKSMTADETLYTIYRKDRIGKPINGTKLEAILHSEHGGKKKLKVKEAGFGKYQLVSSHKNIGKVSIQLRDLDYQKEKSIYENESYPKEYRLEASVRESLKTLKPWDPKQINEDLYIETKKSGQNLFIILAICCMMFGILFRRL